MCDVQRILKKPCTTRSWKLTQMSCNDSPFEIKHMYFQGLKDIFKRCINIIQKDASEYQKEVKHSLILSHQISYS